VLLDEMLDRRLKKLLPSLVEEALTVRERGWGSLENGELLKAAQQEFDVLLTMDQSMPHQQDLTSLRIAVVTLRASSNRLADLAPMMDEVGETLVNARPGESLIVGG
jgi:predicted nuclease of predicted toxin-antitoxin system